MQFAAHLNMAANNLGQFMIDRMRNYGSSVALIDDTSKQSYSYDELIDRIQKLAAGLTDLGLAKGDVLCVITHNHIDYHVIWYAVNLIGAILQTAATTYTDDDLTWRFFECQTKFLITTADQASRIQRIVRHIRKEKALSLESPILTQIIIYGGTADGCIAYDSLLTRGRVTRPAEVDPTTDSSLLLSSSGTTGLPKHVRVTHGNIISNLPNMEESYQHEPGASAIVTVPIFHMYGLHSCVGAGLYSGLRMVVMEKYNTNSLIDLIQQYRPQIINMVPPIAFRVVKHPGIDTIDLSCVTCVTSGAAAFGPEVERKLMTLFGIKYIAQTYGCTETCRVAGNKPDAYKLGSCGVILSGVKFKIVDPETGNLRLANQTGEIRVTGKMVSPGYLNKPEVTRNAYDSEGYFKTGDLGYIDSDGFLFVVDRLKELIKFKGLQVAPAYLEDLLRKHPDIADAAVIGKADVEAGELPKAFVVRQEGSTLTESDVVSYIQDHVAPHMRLRGGAEFIEQIPRTASGKILRRHLRDKAIASKL